MKLPDFLVVGAQKSGTTSLFLLLSKHPELFLPGRKEVQFFSSPMLYPKGIDWYAEEFFATCPPDCLAGEVSPQYMYSTEIARRVHHGLPNAKIIAILREPVARAYSQYQMARRREQEFRSPHDALSASLGVDETDVDTPESGRYFQFSDYEHVLSEYLQLFGRDNILILFQEDLDSRPEYVLRQVYEFLGVEDHIPENVSVRVHKAGDVRFRRLDQLLKGDNWIKRGARAIVPRKMRPTIVFWLEILNIRPIAKDGSVLGELRERFSEFAIQQAQFLEAKFGVRPPWPIAR